MGPGAPSLLLPRPGAGLGGVRPGGQLPLEAVKSPGRPQSNTRK